MSQTVRYLDPQTGKIVSIPASELAPGMLRVNLAGEGEVFIPPETRRASATLHGPFTEEVRQNYLRVIQEAFAEVYPLSLEAWEAGFRRDANPSREVATWLHLARAFEHFTGHLTAGPDGRDEKLDVFELLLACVNNGREHALATSSKRSITRERAGEIVESFFNPATWAGGAEGGEAG